MFRDPDRANSSYPPTPSPPTQQKSMIPAELSLKFSIFGDAPLFKQPTPKSKIPTELDLNLESSIFGDEAQHC